jgi:D-xylose transport system permease protein
MRGELSGGRPPPLARLLHEAEADGRMLAMVGALVAIGIILDLASGGVFLSARNLYNLAVQSSVVGVMATGMVLVIVARHIDLSVGSVLGFTGMLIAALQVEWLPQRGPWAWPVSVAAGLAAGALIGAWQGYWVAYRGVPAFVVTLAGLLVFRGGAWLVTDGRTVAPLDPTYELLGGGLRGSIGAGWSWMLGATAVAALAALQVRGRRERRRHGFAPRPLWVEAARLGLWTGLIVAFVSVMNAYTRPQSDVARGVPVPVLILIAVVVAMSALARVTRFGRYVFALGGSPEAAALAGIDVRRVTLGVFTLMGLLCAVAAVLTTARLGAGASSMGTLAELSVIAAAVIGGTSLSGGVGSVAGAILGAVIMQSLDNGMVLLDVSSALRQVLIGLVLIVAVWADSVYGRRRSAA